MTYDLFFSGLDGSVGNVALESNAGSIVTLLRPSLEAGLGGDDETDGSALHSVVDDCAEAELSFDAVT